MYVGIYVYIALVGLREHILERIAVIPVVCRAYGDGRRADSQRRRCGYNYRLSEKEVLGSLFRIIVFHIVRPGGGVLLSCKYLADELFIALTRRDLLEKFSVIVHSLFPPSRVI